MSHATRKKKTVPGNRWSYCILFVAMLVTAAVYSTGLSGAYLFDDYPNIVDNHAVQPPNASVSSLVGAALSSSSSEFKRPLASLSFAANFLLSGLDPYWMKLTNLVIHLLNGLLVFLLGRSLLRVTTARRSSAADLESAELAICRNTRTGVIAALVASCWLVLPINLTAVLYVVQRMESMANLFVLLGLLGYIAGRRRMLTASSEWQTNRRASMWAAVFDSHFMLCFASITVPTALGILAKETAVMLPFYALLIEWAIFRFARVDSLGISLSRTAFDGRIVGMFLFILVLPLLVGLIWLIPGILRPATWATRDFTLGTRLLSEARIVVDYIVWTLLPTPDALSFYHDNFRISTGLFSPGSTILSIGVLTALFALMFRIRSQWPLVSLGIALFFGCHLLTGTIIPLELVYEHRNYFASLGILLAIVPLLAAPGLRTRASTINELLDADASFSERSSSKAAFAHRARAISSIAALPMVMLRYALLAGLMICWAGLTALTSYAWGNPLRLAEDLAARAPMSPRAEYELGRTYIIYSHYDPASPFTKLAYVALEKAAALPESSILPEQALIFMNARMKLPIKNAWWESMTKKLKVHKPGVQDESSLEALSQCVVDHRCDLPKNRMIAAYLAALSHPNPSPRLLAEYSNYCWNGLGDKPLAIQMIDAAVKASPTEPAYLITQVRMLAAESKRTEALKALDELQRLNYGGRLSSDISQLKVLPELK